MLTISQTWVPTYDEDNRASGYHALNASGKGHQIAVVAGPVIKASLGHDSDGGQLDDGLYALRDILAFARRGERGLSIAG
jgi:hypothetical protein